MTKLEELIAALEKSEGPSRDFDWRIAQITNLPEVWPETDSWPPFMAGSKFDKAIPLFTASIDAAVALVDRVIPGAFWKMSCGRLSIQEPLYAIRLLFGSDEILGEAEGDSLPVTICLATLRAKLSQGEA